MCPFPTRLPVVLLLLALPGAATAAEASDPNVRIYRCVASSGAVSLQDAPCGEGRQQVLNLQRPQDPPARAASTAVPAATPAVPPREVRIVTVQPPQPLYECISADGERYTSDTAEGRPRQVTTWAYGYAPGGVRGHPARPRPPAGSRPPHDGSGHRPAGGVIVPYSVEVRDECHALPQQEVCARLADRRWELIRRYNSALQSEREALGREQRGIEARMHQDCGRP